MLKLMFTATLYSKTTVCTFGIVCVCMKFEPDNEQIDYSDKAHELYTVEMDIGGALQSYLVKSKRGKNMSMKHYRKKSLAQCTIS